MKGRLQKEESLLKNYNDLDTNDQKYWQCVSKWDTDLLKEQEAGFSCPSLYNTVQLCFALAD